MVRLPLWGLSFGLFVYPVFWVKGWKHGAIYTAIWLIVAAAKAWRELSPRNLQMFQKNYLERKLTLYRLMQRLEGSGEMTRTEVRDFQEHALRLIASYVRDYRADINGTQIFANLLVSQGDSLVVIARDQPHPGRSTPAASPKAHMLASRALETGQYQVTGDVYADFSQTPPGKPYSSILAIPVQHERACLGVVCIDSSRRYHFDLQAETLVKYIYPYVGMLAWTLKADRLLEERPRLEATFDE